jgi:hypothetical protein
MRKAIINRIILGIYVGCAPTSTIFGEINFNEDIRPILNSKCIACHGGVKKTKGFSVAHRSDALAVTESGTPAIIP